MSTRKRKANDITISSSTEYQLHKSQLFPIAISKFLIDFTSIKMVSYIGSFSEGPEKEILQKALRDYKKGNIAIAWRSGKPIWINVIND